jgi:hypothetical protein
MPPLSLVCSSFSRPVRRGAAAIGWLFSLVLVVTGCAAATGHGGQAARPQQASLAPWQADVLDHADQILIGDCMRQRGFQYWTYPAHNFLDQLFPYVFDNVAWSQRYGYGNGDASSSAGVPGRNAYYVSTLSASRRSAYSLALSGSGPGLQIKVPDGGGIIGQSSNGCLAWADGHLYGGFPAWFRANTMAFLAQPLLTREVEESREYQIAVAQWSKCMRADGYTYTSPAQAHDGPSTPANRRRTPIQTAVAEARCANSTSLANTARRLSIFYTSRLPGSFQSSIRNELMLEHVALTRARRIIRR